MSWSIECVFEKDEPVGKWKCTVYGSEYERLLINAIYIPYTEELQRLLLRRDARRQL